MAKSTHRQPLGKFNYKDETAYGFAIVIVEFVNSSPGPIDRVTCVEEAIKRWTEAKVVQAQPSLTRKLERTKDGLMSLQGHINELLRSMDRPEEAPSDGG